MARNVLLGVLSAALLGFFGWSVFVALVVRPDAPIEGSCDRWLGKPEPKWLLLSGCVLDVDDAVLESEAGDFELLVNRAKGLSTKLREGVPRWTATWVPVKSQWSGGLIKAVFRVESPELMRWVNALEAADEGKRARLWADQSLLQRIERPGVLSGRAEKATHDGLQKTFGAAATAGLLVVVPGRAPPPSVPFAGLLAGVLGAALALFTLRQVTRSPHLDEATAEQLARQLGTSDVKLELGALEDLRREEAERRKRP